MQPMVEMIQDN